MVCRLAAIFAAEVPYVAMTDTSHTLIIEVAVPLPLERTFHYRVPPPLETRAVAGCRALVPFGKRHLTAYILGRARDPIGAELKEIIDVLDPEPLWTDGELEFFRWIASYYLHPLGEVLKTALPAGINLQSKKGDAANARKLAGGIPVRYEAWYHSLPDKTRPPRLGAKAAALLDHINSCGESAGSDLRRRFGQCLEQLRRLETLGLLRREEREAYRDPFRSEQIESDVPKALNSHQQTALTAVRAVLDRGVFSPFLLHGVTGSGKTEVYLQCIAHALALGRTALVLVPEISLTPQLVLRFRRRFSNGIAVLHSALSEGERYDEWRRIRRGQVNIVIGARSALFAPLERLGVIVVDEEHEQSFKQGDGLRYNARDLALVRGNMEQAAVLLGSATPQITSLYAAEQGRLTLLKLPERVEKRPMPEVELVPLRFGPEALSPVLARELTATLDSGSQALVFINRRGFATFLVCSDCGAPLTCPNCSVSLTYHRQRRQSVCHYCDYAVPAPGTCPACGSSELRELGAGTERVEHDLQQLLPQARIVRMDSDTTGGKGGHRRLLDQMASGQVDILVGTQMIAKGHDFPDVTLVGVINGEASLGMPDFRAAERTYQLLSQVIGRAGRGEQPGRVVVQAATTEHYAIQCAAAHDNDGFYRQELEFRREAGYPPFTHLAAFGFSAVVEQTASERAAFVARQLTRLKQELKLRLEILGPAPAPLYRLRGRFRLQILLKAPARSDLRRLIAAWLSRREAAPQVREYIDIDPLDLM